MSRFYSALQQRPEAAPVPGPRPPAQPRPGAVTHVTPLSAMQPASRASAWSPVAASHVPAAVEQYRRLAAELVRAQEAHDVRTVLIASAAPGEGKSVTAANLALTLARSYRRNVLLVDADLRLPSLHEIFNVSNTTGLGDLLAGGQFGRVAPIEVFPSLTLLPAGRPTADPVGILSSPQLQRLVEEASTRFDWVIIDTPPVALLTDAKLLTSLVDAVLLVIAAGRTQYDYLARAVQAVGRERILGVVLNRVTEGVIRQGYGSYYRR
jgi:protein-tyrosine kinase